VPSTLQEEDIQDLVELWEDFPMEDHMETVVFRSFYEKGFTLPAGAFFRGLLFFYGEAFLGIAPHFNLWRALYHLRGYPSATRRNVVGGTAFSLR